MCARAFVCACMRAIVCDEQAVQAITLNRLFLNALGFIVWSSFVGLLVKLRALTHTHAHTSVFWFNKTNILQCVLFDFYFISSARVVALMGGGGGGGGEREKEEKIRRVNVLHCSKPNRVSIS